MILVGTAELPGIGTLTLFRGSNDDVRPSSDITGKVQLALRKQFLFVRGIWVKFSGHNSVRIGEDGNKIVRKVDLFEGLEDYYHGGFHDVLYGFGEEDCRNDAESSTLPLLQLREGNHSWNFTFRVPDAAKAPPTYCDDNTEVDYKLVAMLDSPEIPPAVSVINHSLSMIWSTVTAVEMHTASSSSRRPVESSHEIVSYRPKLSWKDCLGSRNDKHPLMTVASPRLSVDASTIMRIKFQHLQSADRRSPNTGGNGATLDFVYGESALDVSCEVDTVKEGSRNPLVVLARLVTVVNLRSDPTVPFQSLPSLLMGLDWGPEGDSGPRKSSRHKNTSANKAANQHTATGQCRQLWSHSVVLESPKRRNTVPFRIPVKVDPTIRSSCLADWPGPTPLPHDTTNAVLNFTTSGPFFEYRVVLEVMLCSFKRGRRLKTTDSRLQLCPSCVAEVFIKPQVQDEVTTIEVYPDVLASAPTFGASFPGVDGTNPAPQAAIVVDATHSVSQQQPRSGINVGFMTRSNASIVPYQSPFVQRRGVRDENSHPNANVNAVGSDVLENPGKPPVVPVRKHKQNVNAQEGAVPSIASPRAPKSRQSKHLTTKPPTPQATAIQRVPRVVAEPVSRGPAAVVRDRTNASHRDVRITPSRFAPAVPVGQEEVLVLGSVPASVENGLGHCVEEQDDVGPPFVTIFSPVMAVVCSPRTTEQLFQQELSERLQMEQATSIPLALSPRNSHTEPAPEPSSALRNTGASPWDGNIATQPEVVFNFSASGRRLSFSNSDINRPQVIERSGSTGRRYHSGREVLRLEDVTSLYSPTPIHDNGRIPTRLLR